MLSFIWLRDLCPNHKLRKIFPTHSANFFCSFRTHFITHLRTANKWKPNNNFQKDQICDTEKADYVIHAKAAVSHIAERNVNNFYPVNGTCDAQTLAAMLIYFFKKKNGW